MKIFKVGAKDFDTSDSDADLSLSDDDEEDVKPRTAEEFITDPYDDASPPSFDFAPINTDVYPTMELESLQFAFSIGVLFGFCSGKANHHLPL
ncbi:UNVERIFIED_CONTAM: hypothetical protein FKN15_005633 [Acipenser sinensis]